jgi:hypothetical protein
MITSMTVVKSGLGNQVLQIKKGFKNSMITPQICKGQDTNFEINGKILITIFLITLQLKKLEMK